MAVYALWRRCSRVQRPEWLVSCWPVSVDFARCHVGGTALNCLRFTLFLAPEIGASLGPYAATMLAPASHCPALCGCHRQSLHGPACPLSRALGWPLRFMRHNRMFLCECPRHGLLLRVHPAPSGAWTNEGLDALSTRPGVYVRLNPSASPAPLCAYAVHPWVRNLHCATCSTLDIHGQTMCARLASSPSVLPWCCSVR
ncbi:hypothetical protein V6N12_028963 [Hibiscus sabdariffa]|uniref:Uncharacterized protein n=1 Tax=Hibiscus sabdariffa TaxID=183260 RepID=A0ABR2F7C6_9ROSI